MTKLIIPKPGENDNELLIRCGGRYDCPKDSLGKRLGPLVGYTGRYDGVHQWVSDVYVNFAKAEEHPSVLHHYASGIIDKMLPLMADVDTFCGLPQGGIQLSGALARIANKRSIFLEKEVTVLKSDKNREQSKLVIGRHDVEAGERLVFVEDVPNNFTTTAEAVGLVSKAGGIVVAIVCFFNRSLFVENFYYSIPVVSLVREKIMEYQQDNPAVLEDVSKNNVVWKPKNKTDWAILVAAMRRVQVNP